MLEIGGRRLRDFGSTGQQRSAAVALKLIEIAALREARATEPASCSTTSSPSWTGAADSGSPVRLIGAETRQVFVTAPRRMSCRRAGSGGVERENGTVTRIVTRDSRAASIRAHPLADALTSYLKQAGLAKRRAAGGDHRGVGRAGGPADRRGDRARVGDPDGMLGVRVATSRAWANELSLMAPRILARLNAGDRGESRRFAGSRGLMAHAGPDQ